MKNHHSSTRVLSWLVGGLACLVSTAANAQGDWQRPFRGAVPVSVLLCNFSDAGTPARTRAQYEDFIVNSGTGGLADFWRDTSFGSIVMDGSVVRGWFTLPLSTSQGVANSKVQTKRIENYDACIDAASRTYRPPSDHIKVVITNHNKTVHPADVVDGFGTAGGVFQGETTNVTAMAHEMGHAMRLNHSFSDTRDPATKIDSWEALGEYDDLWDLMSGMRVASDPTGPYGAQGPGLNAYHRDRMGWLARDKILRFGADGKAEQTVVLTSLDRPNGAGYQLVRIPFTGTDLYQYFTVEYRNNEGWDAAFAQDWVLIHVVTYRDFSSEKEDAKAGYYSFVFRETTGDRKPVQTLSHSGVEIEVLSTDPANGRARVRIRSERPLWCVEPYVWREATRDDRVCVSAQRREQVRQENSDYYRYAAPGPRTQGNIRCRQGYVWREATPVDQVCVTPENRDRVREENRDANKRTIGFNAWGPNTCKPDFVWREADERDWVCVSRQRRDQVQEENRNAASRRQPGGGAYGPDTCRSGFVWRGAFPGDRVCVSGASRDKALEENRSASSRLANKEA